MPHCADAKLGALMCTIHLGFFFLYCMVHRPQFMLQPSQALQVAISGCGTCASICSSLIARSCIVHTLQACLLLLVFLAARWPPAGQLQSPHHHPGQPGPLVEVTGC